MKKQTYLCVDLQTYTCDTHLKQGQGRRGTLAMTEQDEKFFFIEEVHEHQHRNTKVYKGKRLNVLLDGECRLRVFLKKLELTAATDPLTIADEIFVELEQAKKQLRL